MSRLFDFTVVNELGKLYNEKIVTTSKDHIKKCERCGGTIPKGTLCLMTPEKVYGKYGGGSVTIKTHRMCEQCIAECIVERRPKVRTTEELFLYNKEKAVEYFARTLVMFEQEHLNTRERIVGNMIGRKFKVWERPMTCVTHADGARTLVMQELAGHITIKLDDFLTYMMKGTVEQVAEYPDTESIFD